MVQNKLPIFSSAGYQEVLVFAHSRGFTFVNFNEKDSIEHSPGNFCLMRHDIDVSLKCALEMAVIESDHDVRATYFFMLSSPAYNLFSRYAYHVLQKIKSLGHEIALHYDGAHPIGGERILENEVLKEAKILSDIVGEEVQSVSFHQPSSHILKGETFIPGLINTYNKKQMENWLYSSDSNRVWKEHNALSVFSNPVHKRIQLLIHPIWWIYSDPLVQDAWDKAIIDNYYIMQEQFLATEGAYGPARKFLLDRPSR